MSVEKIKAIAKEKYGRELTDEQAAAYAEKHGKLSDEELDNVAGGCYDYMLEQDCPQCGSSDVSLNLGGKGSRNYTCNECGHHFVK